MSQEVPQQIQRKMAAMELGDDSRNVKDLVSPSESTAGQARSFFDGPDNNRGPRPPPKSNTASSFSSVASSVSINTVSSASTVIDYPKDYPKDFISDTPVGIAPSFSHFPPLKNRPTYVPPSSEETEALLEQTRLQVLRSNDPEMQLAWAQDALIWVEIAQLHASRIAEQNKPRPQTPQIEHQLKADAISIVQFLADQFHPKADFIRGMWLEFGKFGIRMDKKEAFRAYARAASKGYARAEYRMGMQFENSNEYSKAIQHYNQGATQGDSASNYRLGMMTLLGQHGQKQDFAKGVHLVRQSAQKADENAPQGAYVYGMLLARELNGLSIPELFLPVDTSAARQNIEKAAYLGFSKAQVRMGAAYEHAQLGCEFHPELSLHYNALAARQSEPEAEMAISKWFLCGHPGIFDKNEELAFVYAQRAARDGYPAAEFAMGYLSEIGLGTPQDLKEAQRWYNIAASHGNKDAEARVDGIKRSKTLSRKDHEDVAVNRIRSQRGDRRQDESIPESNEDRPPLPSNTESEKDKPDHRYSVASQISVSSAYSQDQPQAQPPNQPPPRPVSTAPYPVHENEMAGPPRPPSVFINPHLKSHSVGPGPPQYPPDPRQGLTPDYPNRPRKDSAPGFINPNLRANTANPVGPGRPGPGYPPSSGGYRPAPGGGPNQRPPYAGGEDRRQSAPYQPSYQSQQVPPQGGRSRIGSTPEIRPQPGRDASPQRIDVGYSAPLEPPASQRTKLTKPQPPGRDGPSPASSVHSASSLPPPKKPDLHKAPSAEFRAPGQYRPQKGSNPSDETYQPVSGPAVPNKLPAPSAPHAKPPGPVPTPPLSTQGPSKPPASTGAGTGPKTFEEIGIPHAKKEDDCVSKITYVCLLC
jgi:TPR repeat protein